MNLLYDGRLLGRVWDFAGLDEIQHVVYVMGTISEARCFQPVVFFCLPIRKWMEHSVQGLLGQLNEELDSFCQAKGLLPQLYLRLVVAPGRVGIFLRFGALLQCIELNHEA